MNYQYRFGSSFTTATQTLYHDGGFPRYYLGISAALVQGRASANYEFSVALSKRANPYRTRLTVRGYGSQRRNSRFAPIELVLERLAVTYQDDLRFSMVRRSRSSSMQSPRLTLSPGTDWTGASAAAFRMILTPIDTLKTTLQAQGARGTALLRHRIKSNGIGSLWWGAFATAAATFVGHYPWFATVCSPSSILGCAP